MLYSDSVLSHAASLAQPKNNDGNISTGAVEFPNVGNDAGERQFVVIFWHLFSDCGGIIVRLGAASDDEDPALFGLSDSPSLLIVKGVGNLRPFLRDLRANSPPPSVHIFGEVTAG